MQYNKSEFRRRIKKIFEDGISGIHPGLAFKDHFDLLKCEAKWLGYNMALVDLRIIDLKEYGDNIGFISKYYNIFIGKKDIRKDIKELDNNITNVVSREDGTLEICVIKQKETTKQKVMRFISQRCLDNSFLKIDFHEVGSVN